MYSHKSRKCLCVVHGEVPTGMHIGFEHESICEPSVVLRSQNDESGLFVDAVANEVDYGLIDSIFEIKRKRALADSSGADSFLSDFDDKIRECYRPVALRRSSERTH